MHSLFWKIFLWFWGAMVIIGLALTFVVLSTRPDPMPEPWREAANSAMTAQIKVACRIWEEEGEAALTQELRNAGQDARAVFWLFDADGNKLGGPPLPPPPGHEPAFHRLGGGREDERDHRPRRQRPGEWREGRGRPPGGMGMPWQPPPPRLDRDRARELARSSAEAGETVFEVAGADILAARLGSGARGKRYLLAGLLPQPRFARSINGPHTQWLGALVALGVSGLVCFGLVRFLTAPLVTLREATRRLAAGDLEARTGAGDRRRRDEVADLGRDFDAMAGRIETLVKSERQLLGDISHELRSPLSRLTLALALARRHAQDERVPAEMRQALDRIGRETVRLDGLIAQLLELVRLESGDEYAVRESLDLEALVMEVVADADFEAASHQERHVVFHSQGPIPIHGVSGLLRSAVENVVRNASRHTAPGTTVEVTLARVPAGTALRANGADADAPALARITVRDHGPGVPEEALERLFRPFFRVEQARDRNSGGVGLGLAIVERAVAAHHGRVHAANLPGGGLEMRLELPLEE